MIVWLTFCLYFSFCLGISGLPEKIHPADIEKVNRHKKLLLFVSITSAPAHSHLRDAIRNTWLRPCMNSLSCDYRFFLDINSNLSHPELRNESDVYQDMVFRDACPIMERHPPYVNYGNSPPVDTFLHHRDLNKSSPAFNQTIEYPDYPSRRLYKVDWKTCFLRHTQQYSLVLYHIFVEDDSFVCMKNMLYQLTLLQYKLRLFLHHDNRWDVEMPNESRPFPLSEAIFLSGTTRRTMQSLSHTADTLITTPYDSDSWFLKDNHTTSPFAMRTGTFMYDGFDDSSTILNHRVAKIFNDHYPSEDFHCGPVLDTDDGKVKMRSVFLSWGNSWMAKNCNWINEILRIYQVRTIKPVMSCHTASVTESIDGIKPGPNMKPNTIILPCVSHPLVFHHHSASNVLLVEEPAQRIRHLCEYLLLVDKIKHPQTMYELYNASCASMEGKETFHDFSDLFFYNSKYGWDIALFKLQQDEQECQTEFKEEHKTEFNYTDTRHGHNDYPCAFALPETIPIATEASPLHVKEESHRRLREYMVSNSHMQRTRRKLLETKKRSISYLDYFDVGQIMKFTDQ